MAKLTDITLYKSTWEEIDISNTYPSNIVNQLASGSDNYIYFAVNANDNYYTSIDRIDLDNNVEDWTTIYGSSIYTNDITIADDGSVYTAGYTTGSLYGGELTYQWHLGREDAFIRKTEQSDKNFYSNQGWTRLFGASETNYSSSERIQSIKFLRF